ASNFKVTPPGNGAWLIKNSWGTGKGNGSGYMWVSYYNKAYESGIYAFTVLPKGTEPTYINKTYTPKANESVNIANDFADAYYMQTEISNVKTPTTVYKSNIFRKEKKTILDKYENVLGYATFIVKPTDTSLTMSKDMTEKLNQYQLDSMNQDYAKQRYLTVTLDGVDVKNSSYTTYISSNPNVVSVNNSGILTYNGFGDAVVTATFKDATITDGKAITGSCKFSLQPVCSEIIIENGSNWIQLTQGDTRQLSVTTTPADTKVTYTSNNPCVSVSDTGTITAVSAGQATITVTDADNAVTKTIMVNVVAKQAPVVTPPAPVTPTPTPVNPNPVTPVPQTPQTPATPQTPQTVVNNNKSSVKTGEKKNVGGFSKVYLHSNKTAEIIKVSTSKKTVTVPSYLTYKGVKYKVTTIGASAFKGSKATKITLPGTLKYIDEKAFYGCKNLTSITLPSSIRSIGKNAFKKCANNLTINVPKNKKKTYQKLWKGKGGTVK
ncbi:MAG: leucine-rich repeat protein, partial [Clostridia bacterium]|nr:leucine-rich repeat protein [Clostridia bacterium]